MDGIFNVYKEAGYTSHDVVARLRGILNQKKIGHTGTLDPEATGVLPVCVGRATKVCELLSDRDKTYQAVCRLGVVTDTQDMTGTILEKASFRKLTEKQVEEAVLSYVGAGLQIPPMYSALKVDGKKLYEFAREGKTVKRQPRKIMIYSIKILQMDLEEGAFTMEVDCSKGTYIRTLCHDIGQLLGVGAAMESLVRIRVGEFTVKDAVTLDRMELFASRGPEELQKYLYRIEALFPDYPGVQIRPQCQSKLMNGNILSEDAFLVRSGGPEHEGEAAKPSGRVLVYDTEGEFKAIYEKRGTEYTVVKMF